MQLRRLYLPFWLGAVLTGKCTLRKHHNGLRAGSSIHFFFFVCLGKNIRNLVFDSSNITYPKGVERWNHFFFSTANSKGPATQNLNCYERARDNLLQLECFTGNFYLPCYIYEEIIAWKTFSIIWWPYQQATSPPYQQPMRTALLRGEIVFPVISDPSCAWPFCCIHFVQRQGEHREAPGNIINQGNFI